jgi:2-polyprenyl-3-methyl-5-hydroxy-6-metoxy-1,4-benzoquinol methylase
VALFPRDRIAAMIRDRSVLLNVSATEASMFHRFCAGNSRRELKTLFGMHDLLSAPATDPTPIYRYRDGLYAADLLTAAIVHLDFFNWLANNPSAFDNICTGLELKPRPTDVMLTLFTAMGYIENRSGIFHLTPLGREHLVKDSPFYIGPYYASLKDRPVCKDMLSALRTDRVANWGSFKDEQAWAKAMEDETFANNFTAAMDCRGVYLGQAVAKSLDLSSRRKLLDIGGGSGIYACSLVAHFKNLHAAVFEKPPVDKAAQRAITSRGCTDRVQVIAGDMFKEALPAGFDVHLISNVLHDWDVPEVRKILRVSASALAPGGLLVIHDAWINENKTGPLAVAAYSAMLMHSTEGKCYSTGEMREFLTELGLTNFTFKETAADRGIVTAAKP